MAELPLKRWLGFLFGGKETLFFTEVACSMSLSPHCHQMALSTETIYTG
jgi:hypothetical protein